MITTFVIITFCNIREINVYSHPGQHISTDSVTPFSPEKFTKQKGRDCPEKVISKDGIIMTEWFEVL